MLRRLVLAPTLLVAACLEPPHAAGPPPEAVTTVTWDELCDAQAKRAAKCGRDDGKGADVIATRCLRAHEALKDLVGDDQLRRLLDCPITHDACDDACAEGVALAATAGSGLAAAKEWCDGARETCSDDDDVRISCKLFKKKTLAIVKDSRWSTAVDACRDQKCDALQECIDGIRKDTLDVVEAGIAGLSPLLKAKPKDDDAADDDDADGKKKRKKKKAKDDDESAGAPADGPFELVQGVHVGMNRAELKKLPKTLVLATKGKVDRFRPHVADGALVGLAFETNERGCARIVDALKQRFTKVDAKTTNGKDVLLAGSGADRTRLVYAEDHKRCAVEQGDPPIGD